MTRLLMLTFNRVGKGTYWRAMGYAKELVPLGYEVTLLAVASRRGTGFVERVVDGVHLVETPDLWPSSGYDLWDVVRRVAWLRGRPFDLIHAFENRPVVLGPMLYLQQTRRLPLVIDWCDWFGRGGSVEERPNSLAKTVLRPVESFFEERFRHRADGTTVINSVLRQKAIELGVAADSILLLPNGASVAEIGPQDKTAVRQRLGLPVDVPILGYIGAIFERDALLMARAFDAVQAVRPEVRLLVIGYCNVAMEKLVREETAVIRTGPVPFKALVDHISACDIGWLTLCDSGANRGRFPMKTHDFMAAGVPLLVTDVGDLGTMVREKGIGWVAEAEVERVTAVTLDLLANPTARRQMGQQARYVAETELAWPIITRQLADFYERNVL
ncbi:MAG: glycosyltransferase family 4 protein [Ardenticatenaceae bacterium]|nr:glycosyltransferase family 4 protein [Ardenticatenaceae bacterium]